MKKPLAILLALSLLTVLLFACAKPADPSGSSSSSTDSPSDSESQSSFEESENMLLLREMAALDYPSMTVADFNQKIQDIAAKGELSIFEVISNIYDEGTIKDKNGGFITVLLPDDADLRDFFETTLAYSSQEIFSEQTHMANVAYITTKSMTAAEMRQKERTMTEAAWNDYFNEIVQDIEIYTTLFYEIEVEISDPDTLPVSIRDDRINTVRKEIETFLFSMTPEEINADDLQTRIESKFDEMHAKYSDGQMKIVCRIQSLESIPNE